jgi:DNA repair protein RecO (recombination protein O)
LYTADALILRTYKLGEADRIVVFLTRDRGKKRGVAKGARRPRSRFAGALEPLTEVRVAYFEKERRELVGLNFAETIRSPLGFVGGFPSPRRERRGELGEGAPLRADEPATASARQGAEGATAAGAPESDALGYVSYFAELLDEWAQEADADERLYRLGASMLNALSAGAPVEPLARYFEYWLLRLQGVYPESKGTLSASAMAFLAASRSISPERVSELPAERRALKELETLHRGLIAIHLEKTLKSDRVLRDLRRHN